MISANIGILLTNIGTPTNPTEPAVKQYLEKFLSDPRVIKAPAFLWKPILYGFILPFRSKRSALLYQKIWRADGSPLLHYTNKIAEELAVQLKMPVATGMHYSEPSIEEAFKKLYSQNVRKIIVLPLYPQYSGTTTEATIDRIAALQDQYQPTQIELQTIRYYSDEPDYIQTIAQSLRNTWKQLGKSEHLLFSFHGIPKRYVALGDIYAKLCYETVSKVAEHLQMQECDYSIAFQSRFSPYGWLAPHTDQVLKTLPKKGITDIQVICPGFAVDCLETLEEIAIRGKEQFLNAGGKSFRYITALNDSNEHIMMLTNIILKHLGK